VNARFGHLKRNEENDGPSAPVLPVINRSDADVIDERIAQNDAVSHQPIVRRKSAG
jgi:hypothetical protein